jgi:hypothetical protein
MTITSAIKGQITKATKLPRNDAFATLRRLFSKYMPSQQAKHATRKYLAA